LLMSATAYWIQVSGASVLAVEELASPSFEPGSASDIVFDDVDDASRIRSLIRSNPSRAVDNFVLDVAASDHPKIRTAVVFPPLIYGPGEGPVKRRSVQVPELARVALTRGKAVQVGEGLSRWGNIHVRDVAKVFAGLADAAAGGSEADGAWGENGLYLPSAGEMVRARWITPQGEVAS
jgi:nucleoside-diphosphate-sugar epimerase